jgi:hypothetical protein
MYRDSDGHRKYVIKAQKKISVELTVFLDTQI